MRLYHGTSAVHRRAILRDGLRALDGIPAFVCGSEDRAAGYGARAAAVEAFKRGHTHLKFVREAVVFEIDVHEDLVTIDPAVRGDGALLAGCGPEHITRAFTFDPRPWLKPGDLRRYGQLAALARSVERDWNASRLAASERPR
jgi:hypothetical protein